MHWIKILLVSKLLNKGSFYLKKASKEFISQNDLRNFTNKKKIIKK